MSKLQEDMQPIGGEEEVVSKETKKSMSRKRLLYILLTIVFVLLLISMAIVLGVIFIHEDTDIPATMEINVTSFSKDSIFLSWEKITNEPVSGYVLTISPPPISGPEVITTDPQVDSATFTHLTSGIQFTTTLVTNGVDTPNIATSTVKQYTIPNKPEKLSYDDRQFPEKFILHWLPPKSGSVEMYNVYKRQSYPTSPAPVLIFQVPPIGNLTATVTTGLDHGIYYTFDVRSVVGENMEILSEPISVSYSQGK